MAKRYKENKQLNLPAIDQEINLFWKDNAIFEKTNELRKNAPPFVFFDGPPSANGLPGIHHILSRTLKDIFCRYQTMQGKYVARKAGWDTHGLPIELSVEKKLNIRKDDIGVKISVEDYNKACREQVLTFKDKWEESTRIMGYWVDMQNPYITFDTPYIETLWFLLKRLYDQQLLYKGFTIQPYSPAAGTGLSSHELNQPGCYKTVKDLSVVAMFKLKNSSATTSTALASMLSKFENCYALAWTTTPWTLPSNTALTMGKKIRYSLVEACHPFDASRVCVFICATALCEKQFKNLDVLDESDNVINPKTIATYLGVDFENITYEPLFDYVAPQSPTGGVSYRIITGQHVTTEDGTGIVHTAPAHGSDDAAMMHLHGIGMILAVDENGKFVDAIIDFAGEYVKEEFYNEEEKSAIIEKLKNRNTDTGDAVMDGYNSIIKKIIVRENKYLNVNERITLLLQERGLLFKKEKYEHNYPHCWRTDKPIIYYPLDSWFIKSTARKSEMIQLNKTIKWKPESIGSGRFGGWLDNLQDWNLSRSRFWGTPLPIWRSTDGNKEICIGSCEDLLQKGYIIDVTTIAKNVDEKTRNEPNAKDILNQLNGDEARLNDCLQKISSVHINDLHKPYIDRIVLKDEDGTIYFRENDLIDVWFDSGAMPYAQDYNFINKHKDTPVNAHLPPHTADFIAEGIDQTRGWFYTLHALHTMLSNEVAYKNVISNGHIVDKNGVKMSKRLGNVVDPIETINKYGADATRWYLINDSQPWDSLRFNLDSIGDVQRSLFGTLYNTYNFFALYANIDAFDFKEEYIEIKKRPEIDQWILSSLNTLIKNCTSDYENYEPTKVARAIENFVDRNLSNWYVRLCRRRFWKGELAHDKHCAYQTLYECLEKISLIMAPIAPFFSEYIFKNLNEVSERYAAESIHQCTYPVVQNVAIDAALEERMKLAQDVCSLVLSLRKKSNIKVRQPLQKMYVPILNQARKNQFEKIAELILNEVNVKEIIYLNADDNIIKKKIKPNFKVLGSKLGADMKAVAALINNMQQDAIARLEVEKKIIFEDVATQKKYEIVLEDVDITSDDIPGMLVANDAENTIALDIVISPQLKLEGDSREFVNRIQNLRKQLNFNVLDKINICVEKQFEIIDVIENNHSYICTETLTQNIEFVEVLVDNFVEVDYNDSKLKIRLTLNQ